MRKMVIAGLYLFTASLIFNLILFLLGYRRLMQALVYGMIEGGLAVVIILGGLVIYDYLGNRNMK